MRERRLELSNLRAVLRIDVTLSQLSIMSNEFPAAPLSDNSTQSHRSTSAEPWHSFDDILRRLHQERIYIHPHQLAEFFLRHGLPVDLCYVPTHLKQRAETINANYQGSMARLEDCERSSWYASSLL